MFKIETINPMFEDDIIDNDCIGNIKLRQYKETLLKRVKCSLDMFADNHDLEAPRP